MSSAHGLLNKELRLALSFGILLAFCNSALANGAVRILPAHYSPGQAVGVSIQVTLASGTAAWAAQDGPPSGWTVSDINESGSWDSVNKLVKWGPFFANEPKTLTYKATPPANETGTKTFNGTLSEDGTPSSITGDSDVTAAPPQTPEMDLQGNNISIPDGDTTPSTNDGTDFGSTGVSSGSVTHTFTIENTGSGPLSLTGNPTVDVSGSNASDFTVTQQPTSPVAANGGKTTFKVKFDPTATGLRSATITILNDDSDEDPYDFNVQGNGNPRELVAIELIAPTRIPENSSARCACEAHYSDNSWEYVSQNVIWSQDSPYASIDTSGKLGTEAVSSNQPCKIMVSYNGLSDSHDTMIIDFGETTCDVGRNIWEYYPLDEGNGSVINGVWSPIDGTLVGAKWGTQSQSVLGDSCLVFDQEGSTGKLFPEILGFSHKRGTFMCWVYQASRTVQNAYIASSQIANKSKVVFDIWITPSGKIDMDFGGNDSYSQTNATIPLNKWTHIAVTWAKGKKKVYIDGTLDSSGGSAKVPGGKKAVYLGQSATDKTSRLIGRIDEVAFWSKALKASQIECHASQ